MQYNLEMCSPLIMFTEQMRKNYFISNAHAFFHTSENYVCGWHWWPLIVLR